MIHRDSRHRHLRHLCLVRDPARRLHRHLVWGGALIAAGLAALLHGQGLFSAHEVWLAVPAVLVWSGAVRLVLEPGIRSMLRALARFAVAGYLVLVIEQVGGLTFEATWPVLLIAAGLANVAHALLRRPRPEDLACGGPAS
jgi:hypothetical protein